MLHPSLIVLRIRTALLVGDDFGFSFLLPVSISPYSILLFSYSLTPLVYAKELYELPKDMPTATRSGASSTLIVVKDWNI